MAAPVVLPIHQFCDQNGKPYAGGSLTSYVMGTSTPKPTYTDPDLTALNQNPVRLDSAGRCVMWSDGDLRLVLQDALGNLIWDQPATTIVSAAMEPIVSAPSIADALDLLGINALIAAEATARSNADSAEQSARIAADNAEAATRAAADTAEANTRSTGDLALQTAIENEITRAEAAEANLAAQINADLSTNRQVSVTTDGFGDFTVSWTPPFTYAIKLLSNGSPDVRVVGPLAVQAGAQFTSMYMYLDHCSGHLSFTDGQTPASIPGAALLNTTFTFRVDGW